MAKEPTTAASPAAPGRPTDPPLLPYPAPHPGARRLLVLGVLSVAVIIALFWIWSITEQFKTINWSLSNERSLVERAATEWNTVFAPEPASPPSDQTTLVKIKNTLRSLITTSTVSTSTASPTTSTAAP